MWTRAAAALAVLCVLVIAQSVAASDAVEGRESFWSAHRFFNGHWLIRPLPVENSMTQYTHELLAGEGKLDGTLLGEITSHTPAVPGFFAGLWASFANASVPVRQLFKAKKAQEEEAAAPHGFASGHLGDTLHRDAAAELFAGSNFWLMEVESESMHTGVLRLLSFASAEDSQLYRKAQAGDNTPMPMPSENTGDESAAEAEAVKLTGESRVTLSFSYSFKMSAAGFHPLKTTTSGCTLNFANLEEPAPLECKGLKLTVTDKSNAVATITLLNRTSSTPVVFSAVFRRFNDDELTPSNNASWYTIGLLLVVASFKFGPRLFLKSKGVDPDKFARGHQRLAKLPEAERRRLLQQQYDVMDKMIKEEEAKKAADEKRKESAAASSSK